MSILRRIFRSSAARLALAFVLAFASLIVVAILDGSLSPPLSPILTRALGSLLAAAVVLLLARAIEARPLDESGIALRGALPAVGQGVLWGAALMGGIVGIMALAGFYRVVEVRTEIAPILRSLALFLLVAVYEELVFRGILFRQFEQALGSWLALLITGAIFGAAHLFNPGATLLSTLTVAIGAGAVLGGAYLTTRSIWMAVGIHFAWNFLEGPFFGAAVSGTTTTKVLVSTTDGPVLWTGGAFGPEAGLIALFLTLIVSAVLLRMAARRDHLFTPAWLRPKPSAAAAPEG